MSEISKGSEPGCSVESCESYGWPSVALQNGLIRAVMVPSIGGRIMSFAFDGHDFLWRNSDLEGKLFSPEENQGDSTFTAWHNYGGSKTWPAPQGRGGDDVWAGPPDSVLDSGKYDLLRTGQDASICSAAVRSQPSAQYGVQISREFTLHPNGTHATLHLEMLNTSDRPRRWSLWDVVQIDAEKLDPQGRPTYNDQVRMYVPLSTDSRHENGFMVMVGPQDNPEWKADPREGLLAVEYLFHTGKIGIDSTAGWAAVVAGDDYAFCQRFRFEEDATYPDEGSTVECWTTGPRPSTKPLYHIECEVLGPLRTLQPTESQQFDIEWYATRCPGPIRKVTDVGCCGQRLAVAREKEEVRVSGLFGVFYMGSLQLCWLDGSGQPLECALLGAADPRSVVRLDTCQRVPPGAVTIALQVCGPDGQLLGELDRCRLAES